MTKNKPNSYFLNNGQDMDEQISDRSKTTFARGGGKLTFRQRS